MLYVFGVGGLVLAAFAIFGMVSVIRSLREDDPDKFPLLFRPLAQAMAPMNTFFGVVLVIGTGVIAILGLWMSYKAFTGG